MTDGTLEKESIAGSLILAAGRGSRMKGFDGNKTLLPLQPSHSPYEGERPILLHILDNLPSGPRALVVNHKKDEIIRATDNLDLTYCEQPVLNGTGGALLASKDFIVSGFFDRLIITMGDVPFVRQRTYLYLIEELKKNPLVVLGFRPEDRKQYGVLEVTGETVEKIIEWKYWHTLSPKRQDMLRICNSGIYAVRRKELIRYLDLLEKRPHRVLKERQGEMVEIEEFFMTDLVELMQKDGLNVGFVIADDEDEVMGLDDLQALQKAQDLFKKGFGTIS